MNPKLFIPVLCLAICLASAPPALAKRETFNWFSLEYPDDWTMLWDTSSADKEAVIVRKKDYSALLIVIVAPRRGRTAAAYARAMGRDYSNATAIRDNNSGGCYFEFTNDRGKKHRTDVWAEGSSLKAFIVHGTDPQLRRIMDSFRYE